MRGEQRRQPGAEARRRRRVAVEPGHGEHGVAGDRLREGGERGEDDREERVLARRRRRRRAARAQRADGMGQLGDCSPARARRPHVERPLAGQQQPRHQARLAAVGEHGEDALDHRRAVGRRRAGRLKRLHERGLEPAHGAVDDRVHEQLAAAEVVQDGRVRDADVARHVLQP